MSSNLLFQHRDFRRLFMAQVTSLAGSGLATVGLALLAYDLAGGNAGLVLGTALAIKMVAYVFIAPIAGAYANRLPRRVLLMSLDLARALIVCLLPFVTEVWQVYLLIFLLNACAAVFTPTYQATIPDLLPDDAQYTRALSYSRLAYDIESLASPSIAALALVFMSYDVLFAANGLTFMVSAVLIFSTRLPASRRSEAGTSIWDNLSFGVRAYLATPRLRGLLALSFALACGGAMVIVNTVVIVQGTLGGTEADTAVVLACYGGGSMLVALWLPRWLDQHADRTPMLIGGVLLATALAFGILQPGFVGIYALWFALGVGGSLVQTPAGRLLKRSSNEASRPAVYAAQFALSHACWLVAYPLAGWMGSQVGMAETFALLAACALLATGIAMSLWKPGDPATLAHIHDPVTHAHPHIHDEHHQHEHEGWEGPEPHTHEHHHDALHHAHAFVIDRHHPVWPDAG